MTVRAGQAGLIIRCSGTQHTLQAASADASDTACAQHARLLALLACGPLSRHS
jgi:hypothetical protein